MVLQHMKLSIVLLICVIFIGIAGYMTIEGLSFVDAFYLSITTVSTVGYGDVTPQTLAGKYFTISIIILGVGLAFYTLTLAVSLVVEGQLKELLGRRGMEKRIANLKQHVIVCGAGRVGSNAIAGLQQEKTSFVVIESDKAICERLAKENILVIHGDASQDEVLLSAGVLRAKGVIAALSGDAKNVYITLTAKGLNPEIFVVARADQAEAVEKMRRAGATSVISPAVMGGRHMANAITKPLIMDLMENVFYNNELHLDMAQVKVAEGSALVDKSLIESGIKTRFDTIVIAIERDGEMLSNPKAQEVIRVHDTLILLGLRDSLGELNRLAARE
ncbi:MAG: potassium channel family protein [Acidaminococcaceae bacterium]